MLSIGDIKQGVILSFNGEPFEVIEYQHARTAMRKAFVRSKLRHLINGNVIEKTFNASDRVEEADINKSKANFLYKDQNNAHFMDNETYDQFSLTLAQVKDKLKFIKEGTEVQVLNLNGNPINIDIPKKVTLKVAETEPSVKGDTAKESAMMKPATLETGALIYVPPFIKEEDLVIVNTETGEYSQRG